MLKFNLSRLKIIFLLFSNNLYEKLNNKTSYKQNNSNFNPYIKNLDSKS